MALVRTFRALELVHELPGEEVSDDGVIAGLVVLPPFLALLINRQAIEVELLVRRLFGHPVHLFMHTVKEEPQKFLGVLLAVSRKLGRHMGYRHF